MNGRRARMLHAVAEVLVKGGGAPAGASVKTVARRIRRRWTRDRRTGA